MKAGHFSAKIPGQLSAEINSEGSQTVGEAVGAEPEATARILQRRRLTDGYIVSIDAPEGLPVTSDEIALLRTFLADEIRAILYGEDHRG